MDQNKAFETLLDWGEKYKNLLIEGQQIQSKTSRHLQLSIEKLLKYADYHHYKLSNREFLENIIKENNELLAHYDRFTQAFSEFEDKTIEIMNGLDNEAS